MPLFRNIFFYWIKLQPIKWVFARAALIDMRASIELEWRCNLMVHKRMQRNLKLADGHLTCISHISAHRCSLHIYVLHIYGNCSLENFFFIFRKTEISRREHSFNFFFSPLNFCWDGRKAIYCATNGRDLRWDERSMLVIWRNMQSTMCTGNFVANIINESSFFLIAMDRGSGSLNICCLASGE